jgi:hypothetical protein
MLAVWTTSAAAVNIRIDYSMDASDFFGANNPQGATGAEQAIAAMEAAADFYSGILGDTFSAITPPTKQFYSLGGEANWFWKWRFSDPVTGNTSAMINPQIAADDYVVFVGARDLLGEDLGRGGPGGFAGGFVVRNGQFTDAEQTQISQMTTAFADATTTRGQSTGFSRWGGSIAFDDQVDWHFNHNTNPVALTHDFYSVALHELAHTLGFGATEQWNDLVDGTTFTGANAVAAYVPDGDVPLESADDTAHWILTIDDSTVFGSVVAQEPLMTPRLDPGLRQLLTDLDAAALVDIGWEIELPGGAASAASFVTTSGSAGSAVVASLRASVVPEPSAIMLVLIVSAAGILVGPRRKWSLNRSGSCVARL